MNYNNSIKNKLGIIIHFPDYYSIKCILMKHYSFFPHSLSCWDDHNYLVNPNFIFVFPTVECYIYKKKKSIYI